jgi:hypothetical protein
MPGGPVSLYFASRLIGFRALARLTAKKALMKASARRETTGKNRLR